MQARLSRASPLGNTCANDLNNLNNLSDPSDPSDPSDLSDLSPLGARHRRLCETLSTALQERHALQSNLFGTLSVHRVGTTLTVRDACLAEQELRQFARGPAHIGVTRGAITLAAKLADVESRTVAMHAQSTEQVASTPHAEAVDRSNSSRKRQRDATESVSGTTPPPPSPKRRRNEGTPSSSPSGFSLLRRVLGRFYTTSKEREEEQEEKREEAAEQNAKAPRVAHAAALEAVQEATRIAREATPPIEISSQALAATLAVVDRLYMLRSEGLLVTQRVAVSVNPVRSDSSLSLMSRRPKLMLVARLAAGVPVPLTNLLTALRPAEWSGVVDGLLTASPSGGYADVVPISDAEKAIVNQGGDSGIVLAVGLGGW